MSSKAAAAPQKSDTKPTEDAKLITLTELQSHNTRDDLWMVIGGKAYNVTEFVDEHP